ncbi:helix-turn-helix domain-containing protein [[Clostridium] polysaccharolyticum]|uniref:Helix-turn-helix n=1 Tax=[Clostridium] polysaccharolyticum TaxID=29364 RepID=A0A1H9Y4S5_9FIRM|nr:helix-turn-helix transcriptional regulator [[Clostridium] polysaccharolyticum]SES63870.1 Helix-turn-helix [[Clostridium] polysaccharolyticum]
MGKKRNLTEYGKKVKHKLVELNMTQVELAEIIGTSEQYLGKILFGERSGGKYVEEINLLLGLML